MLLYSVYIAMLQYNSYNHNLFLIMMNLMAISACIYFHNYSDILLLSLSLIINQKHYYSNNDYIYIFHYHSTSSSSSYCYLSLIIAITVIAMPPPMNPLLLVVEGAWETD